MKVRFCIDDIIEYYNIYDHNTAFSAARKQEILQEISAMVEDNKRKETMYYHLQYGLLDIAALSKHLTFCQKVSLQVNQQHLVISVLRLYGRRFQDLDFYEQYYFSSKY